MCSDVSTHTYTHICLRVYVYVYVHIYIYMSVQSGLLLMSCRTPNDKVRVPDLCHALGFYGRLKRCPFDWELSSYNKTSRSFFSKPLEKTRMIASGSSGGGE